MQPGAVLVRVDPRYFRPTEVASLDGRCVQGARAPRLAADHRRSTELVHEMVRDDRRRSTARRALPRTGVQGDSPSRVVPPGVPQVPGVIRRALLLGARTSALSSVPRQRLRQTLLETSMRRVAEQLPRQSDVGLRLTDVAVPPRCVLHGQLGPTCRAQRRDQCRATSSCCPYPRSRLRPARAHVRAPADRRRPSRPR